MTEEIRNDELERETLRLVNLASRLCLGDAALDEEVHALSQELTLGELSSTAAPDEQEEIIAAAERAGSSVNNGGIEAQVEFLLEHNGAGEVEEMIRACAPRSRGDTPPGGSPPGRGR